MDMSVLQAQRQNYQAQLDANRKQEGDLRTQLGAYATQFEQLRGAIFAIDQVMSAMGAQDAAPAVTPAPLAAVPVAAVMDAAVVDTTATPATTTDAGATNG